MFFFTSKKFKNLLLCLSTASIWVSNGYLPLYSQGTWVEVWRIFNSNPPIGSKADKYGWGGVAISIDMQSLVKRKNITYFNIKSAIIDQKGNISEDKSKKMVISQRINCEDKTWYKNDEGKWLNINKTNNWVNKGFKIVCN